MKTLSILFLAFLAVMQSKAAVFNIANGDVAGLIAAINTANANSEADIINLATNGTYTLTAINFTSTLPNTSGNASQRGLPRILDNVTGLDLTINANGSTIIRDNAAPNFGIFSIAGQTVINDLTIRNGRVNAQGAGVFVEFKGNTELNNCKFYDNTSTLDVEGGGGAIYTKSLSILRVTNCYFENNKAVNQGGAISNLLSNLYITNSIFKNNSTTDLVGADPCGGAIYDDGARGDNGELVIRGCTFEGNSSNGQGQGGAMFLFPYNSQSVEVTGCTFKSNSANQGGAFWHKGGGNSGIPDPEYPLSAAAENTTLLFNSCVFDGNTALNASGGALWISDCKLNEIHSCTFKNNTADLGGAVALLTNRAFTFRNSTFNNNTAKQAGAIFAGGISAKLTVQNCTFAANIAKQYGGAMSVPQNSTPVDIINCTFANNQANNPGNGQSGAIHSGTNTGNSTVMIKNNIFYNQTVTNPWNVWKNCNSELNDGGNNLFFPENAGGRCVATPTNSLFTDPLLSPLADNGGLTQTMALQAGSPAINAGAGCTSTDQRGVARVGACDIGAFEYGGTVCNLVVSSNADAGANTLREAINCATSGQTITFAPSMANQTITLASTLEIPVNKNLTIDGLAAANLTISGNNVVRVFLLKSTSVQPTSLSLKNLKIINARTNEYGGGIKAEHQGTIKLENCVFNNNRADDGGSAVCSAFEGYLTILNCNFDGNISTANNTERGSTVLVWGPYAQTIRNSNFTNNKGINGGAINGLNAGLLIEDCNFTSNLTTDAFFDTGKPNDFLRGFGGAIYTDRASQGAPSVVLGSIILRRCKFENNIGNGEGGACYLYTDETDNVLVEECYFNNNESRILTGGTNGGSGGAIEQMNNAKNRGFVVTNSTFSNNKAAVLGGAIRADWADTQITNCTFDNNRALLTNSTGYAANGGALVFLSMSNSFVDITNCTLANNYAGWSGGAITSSDPLRTRIKNNIFFQNTAGNGGNTWNIQQHTSGEMLDLGNNLQFPNKFTTNWNDYNVSATVTIANPLLNAIANNGGFSPTMSLQAGSPAIDAGAGCPTTDQRGNARVGICDIGAFEYGGVVTPTITVSPAILTGFNTTVGTASPIQTYNLKGSNLTTDITVTAPTDYEVSLNGTTFANTVTATIANVQAVAGQTISVRIKASALVGSPTGDVTNASTGAVTKNVALTGLVGIAGDIIYVRTDGNDTNNGYTNTSTGAKLTLQGGFSAVNDGGTVVFNAGTYNEIATITNKNITIQNIGNPTVQKIIVNGIGKTLTIIGGLNVSEMVDLQAGNLISNGNLTLLATATKQAMLIQGTSTNITGNVHVQRYLRANIGTAGLGYRFISSPTNDATLNQISELSPIVNPTFNTSATPGRVTPFPTVYHYDPTKAGDANKTFSTSPSPEFDKGWMSPITLGDAMIVGKGFTVNTSANQVVQITGNINNGNITIPVVTGNATSLGYNLIGNPYPSPILWSAVKTLSTGVNDAIYQNIATGQYAGAWASYVAGVGTNGATDTIAVMQGFFVVANAIGSVNFANSVRTTNYTNPSSFRTEDEKNANKNNGLLRLAITNAANKTDETVVYFNDKASVDFDRQYDALKLQLNGGNLPNIYTSTDKTEKNTLFSINALPTLIDDLSIPLVLQSWNGGKHKINITEKINFSREVKVFLKDKTTNTLHDFSNGAFEFTASAGAIANRFEIVFKPQFTVAELNGDNLNLYPNPSSETVHISIGDAYKGELTLKLTDISGREVWTLKAEKTGKIYENSVNIGNLASGTYILEVNGAGRMIKKIVKQ